MLSLRNLSLLSAILALSALIAVFSVNGAAVFPESIPSVQHPLNLQLSINKPHRTPATKSNKTILEYLERDHRFKTLMRHVEKFSNLRDGLDDENQVMTVFAPTNAAFASMKSQYPGHHLTEEEMEGVLLYHILPQQIQKKEDFFHGRLLQTAYKEKEIDNRHQQIRVFMLDRIVILNMYCKIEEPNVEAANGIIHVIDAVLVPPPNMFSMVSVVPTEFSITVSALHLTGLHEKLASGTSLTFFAPNNQAWQSLGHERLMHLFDPNRRDQLREVLLYHISPELLYSFELTKTQKMELESMLPGYTLSVEGYWEHGGHKGSEGHKNERIMMKVNGHDVAFLDAISKNGNMHVVEKLLCPCDHHKPKP
ncbi:FAS1 domain-containing protein [Paraphysoderma sedebokerense]|nr:FAS1 domain-containing protein [Paraphysoderma sedebokerense]